VECESLFHPLKIHFPICLYILIFLFPYRGITSNSFRISTFLTRSVLMQHLTVLTYFISAAWIVVQSLNIHVSPPRTGTAITYWILNVSLSYFFFLTFLKLPHICFEIYLFPY
jgi:hypothetical protein